MLIISMILLLWQMFVVLVWSLIKFIVGVAYWIGIPFYLSINNYLTIVLILFGHWILLNVVFNYYMALITPPGHPPKVSLFIDCFHNNKCTSNILSS